MKKSILVFLTVVLIMMQAACPLANAVTIPPLPAPESLKAEIMASYVRVSTTDKTPTGQYTIIEKSVDSGDFYSVSTLSPGMNSFNDYGLTNGRVYKYRAKRYNSQTTGGYSNEAEIVYIYPTTLNITNAYNDQIDLTWSYPQLTVDRTADCQTVIERRLKNESSWTVVYTAAFLEQEYRDHGLKSDSVYYYRIRTKYTNGQYSSYIPTSAGISSHTTISLTTPLTGFALTDTRICLEWDASALNGTKAYLQKMSSDGDFTTIYTSKTQDHYIDSDLTDKKEYFYRLYQTSDNGSVSDFTEILSVMTETMPSPTTITASPISLGRIVLSWSYPYDVESGFEVWRKEEGASWQRLDTLSRNITDWIDYTALSDKTYTYKVRAIRGENVFSNFITSTVVSNADPSDPPPLVIIPMEYYLLIGTDDEAPFGVTYTMESRKSINDIWKDHTSSEAGRPLIVSFLPLSGQEYDIRLRSENHGNVAYGPIHHIYASKPEAPLSLKIASLGSNRVLLTWSDNTGKEDGYHIYRTYGGKRTLIGKTAMNESRFADTGVTPGSAVKYEVCAFNTRGESGVVSVNTSIPRKAAFNDISGILWGVDAVNSLCSIGAISPNPEALFYPNKTITTAEFVTILLKSFDIVPDSGFLFSLKDVPPNTWYYPYIMTAVKHGIIIPDKDGRVTPLSTLSKADAAICLNRLAAFKNKSLNIYGITELDRISDGYLVNADLQGIVASLVGDYIMPAQNGTPLNLDTPATRIEAAAIIYKFYKKYR